MDAALKKKAFATINGQLDELMEDIHVYLTDVPQFDEEELLFESVEVDEAGDDELIVNIVWTTETDEEAAGRFFDPSYAEANWKSVGAVVSGFIKQSLADAQIVLNDEDVTELLHYKEVASLDLNGNRSITAYGVSNILT